jgi:hypothetical protein
MYVHMTFSGAKKLSHYPLHLLHPHRLYCRWDGNNVKLEETRYPLSASGCGIT